MALAAIGLLLMLFQGATSLTNELRSDLLKLTLAALPISVAGLMAVLLNGTNDYTYASYIISMWVWLSGAYTVIFVMKKIYDKVPFVLLANYMIAVCVAQCILAQLIHHIPSVADFIDDIMMSTGFMGKMENRLYGLGCALDVAGLKFSGVLIITMYLAIHTSYTQTIGMRLWHLLAFAIITILGSMIARTTSVGALVAISYLLLYTFKTYFFHSNDSQEIGHLWKTISAILFIIVPTCFILYRYNQSFREMFDFGFEGFISLFKDGKWEVRSNEQLNAQWYWPDTLQTWIFGDGYFDSPNLDPYYIGENYEGFYKGTDVGWCRFIFYFGLVGLIAFSCFFIYAAYLCGSLHPQYKLLFWLLVLMNFIGWNKVSSDIFPIFAIFIMLGSTALQNRPLEEIETNRNNN